MKSSAPWSVKGVEKDARETAKEAARREGMTVGEWLNQVIYTASDPASSNGQIEGLKISDLVSAIEHVSKRVIGAEARSAEVVEEIGRNLGGVVDRLQRLERQPSDSGALPLELEARLEQIEARTGTGRERIEALKALEKAVGQVALQFDAAQKTSAQRLQSIDDQMSRLGARVEDIAASAGSNAAGVAAIDHLKNTIDGVSARIARLERAAQDVAKTKPDPQGDPEFVERTSTRLRVLGDEIKRGGDQIRALEGVIKKLSDQIDAAERRSAEGVHKVAETIAALRSQIVESEAQKTPDQRSEIEAALADTERRTEDRINNLQRSLEAVLDRLERASGLRPATEPAPAISAAAVAPAAATPSFVAAAVSDDIADDLADEAEEALSAFDLDFSEDRPKAAAAPAADDFDLDDDAHPGATTHDAGQDILAEVEAAFAAKPVTPAAPSDAGPKDDIDSILAELDGFGEPGQADAAAVEDSAPPPVSVAAPKPAQNYLAEARRAAKEAAEKAAAEAAEPRRKLTPKQRAILAAKVKKKRLAAEQAAQTAQPSASEKVAPTPAPETLAAERGEKEAPRSFIAKAAAAIGGVLPLVAKKGVAEAAPETAEDDQAAEAGPSLRDRAAPGKSKVKPLTVALGVAIVLALTSLVFVVKDMILGGKPKSISIARTDKPAAAPAPTVAIKDPAALEVPSAPVVKPRALYLDSVAKLKSATSEGETLAAMKGLEEAAALGHPPAQLQLGELYKLGQGVPQDPAQARAWYERAANGGNVLAMHRVGVMAARGQGGPADQAAAIAWFEKAAGLGLVDSQYNLGAIFHPGGEGAASGAQDAVKAYFWYSLAAKNGDSQAGSLAAGLGSSLSAEKRRTADADVAKWVAGTPDPDANEVAPAS